MSGIIDDHIIWMNEIHLLKAENSKLLEGIKKKEDELSSLKSAKICKKKSTDVFERRMKESVKSLVDEMLENNKINNSYIPDFIERKLYENVFTVIISLLKETLENTSIKLLNQNITLNIEPDE
jgi:hypothetical protein